MNDKHFEDIVRKELENFEIQPSEGLFDKVMTARQGKAPSTVAFFSSKTVALLTAGLFLATSWIFINSSDNIQHEDLNNSIVTNTSQNEMLKTLEENTSVSITSETLNPEIEQVKTKNLPNYNESPKSNPTQANTSKSKSSTNPSIRKTEITTTNQQSNINSNPSKLSGITNFVGTSVESYPLTFNTIDNSFDAYYAEQLFSLQNKIESKNDIPVTYKKPGVLRNYWINNIELGIGVGSWTLPKDTYAEGFEETSPFSINAHLRTRIKLSSNLSILTGLAFNQRSATYSYSKSESNEVMKIDTVNGFIIDPGAPPIPVTTYDTSYSTVVNNYAGKGRNVYSRISLPIGVEYHKNFKQNLFYANAGVLINVISYSKGSWLPEESMQLQEFNGKTNQLSSSLTTGYFAGLGYGYKLNNKFTLLFEGNVNAWNVSRNPLGIYGKNLMINGGLSTGVRWNF